GAASLLVLMLLPAASRGATADVAKIVGTWRGTSTCVDLKAAPACKDEVVVYEIAAGPGSADKVGVKGGKGGNGERQHMGDLEYTLGKDGVWTSEFESPNVRSRWTLTVHGSKMTGTGTLVPSNAPIRRMELQKDR